MKTNKKVLFGSLICLSALGIAATNVGLTNNFQRIYAEGITRDIDFAPLLVEAIDNDKDEDTQRVTVYYEGIPFTFECKNVYADKEKKTLVISQGYIQNITAFNGLLLIDVDAEEGYENAGCGVNYGTYSGSDVNLNGQYSSVGFDAIEPDINATNFVVVNKLTFPTIINKINIKYSCGAIEGELTDTSSKYFSSKFHLGTGTEENPYIIGDYDDYLYLRSRTSSSYHYQGEYIKLAANIEVKYAFTPSDIYFAGHFDGGDHKITLDISSDSGDNFGLFPFTYDASFENIKLDGSVSADYVGNVGALVGKAYKTSFEDIDCEANVSGYQCVGGIIGDVVDAESSISYCNYKTGNVTATSNEDNQKMCAGAIVGESNSDISNCTFSKSGTVQSKANAGGIIGVADDISVSNCYITGSVSGGTNVGGIAGDASGEISSCGVQDSAEINGDTNVGGIVGSATNAAITIENCSVSANITFGFSAMSDYAYFGGILGYANGIECEIQNCFSIDTLIDATKYVGGIVGYSQYLSLDSCKFVGNINANEYAGGIAGGFIHGEIKNSQTGEVDNPVILKHKGSTKTVFGGIVGETYGTVETVNAYVTLQSDIVGDNLSSLTHVGGIVGSGVGPYYGAVALNVYVSDDWFCDNPLVGSDPQYTGKYIGSVSDSYALGDYADVPYVFDFNNFI